MLEQAALFDTGMEWLAAILEGEARPQWAALMRQSDGHSQALQCRSESSPTDDRPLLSDVTAPVLMFIGEHEAPDPMPPIPSSASVTIIPGADHAGGLEATDLVIPAVVKFLDEHSAPRR